MKRVLVIGCPGSGKSTFSRTLQKRTGLPLYHLDLLWHKPDKTTVTASEFDAALSKILVQDEWIMDGNFQRTMDLRLACCDTVFLLDYPVEVCIAGVEGRIGKPRPDMPWREESFDPEFRQYILDFSHERLPDIYRILAKYHGLRDIFVFHSRDEANAYLLDLS